MDNKKINKENKELRVKINVLGKNRKRRATFAVRELRAQIKKHFRTEMYVIDPELNAVFWKEGKKNAPSKVSIVGVGDAGKVYVFLEGSNALKNFKKSGKKTEQTEEKQKEERKVAPKKEEAREIKDDRKKEKEKKDIMKEKKEKTPAPKEKETVKEPKETKKTEEKQEKKTQFKDKDTEIIMPKSKK